MNGLCWDPTKTLWLKYLEKSEKETNMLQKKHLDGASIYFLIFTPILGELMQSNWVEATT